MKKVQLLVVFAAVLAFSVVAVASASATLWLIGGKSVTTNTSVPVHGTIILVHKGGSTGNSRVECSGLFIGTVGASGADKITLVENLSGSEKDLIGGCTRLEGLCFGAVIHAVHLSWSTQLALEGGATWDKFTGTGGNPGWNVLCSFGVEVECTGEIKAKFEGNGANGAQFKYKGAESGEAECSDGGTGTVESPSAGEALGAFVS